MTKNIALASTTTEPTAPFLLTTCDEHGTKECQWQDAAHYVELVNSWRGVLDGDDELEEGVSAWFCCSRMVVDPWGAFDH